MSEEEKFKQRGSGSRGEGAEAQELHSESVLTDE